ncbi:probable ubiquitin carboxyl-terminal hydrolase MINDY-4 isoform X4 [Pezoporus wallicus]|uniref:probable ubiquitin carboxyl-terminal hydrolase MINDY-4 isoform X4 n=1 Tax=Pezoporus wallicus TaxID=35540 RepID=UPI00254E47A7|nr:probable ubiquitin carboxyl-terminal hydrolase MINDY-4 isoform X4 [Pezoporus wallicus]XP_061330474.1 probable ubiquitin carboxyl-terminal hydrolase MINDY-4 isoform X4 [Pezoporus flaviventris]
MENSFVEEVAASLIREFLSRKGLKKTITTMDQELPRSELSINNRNELRNVLHLHSLYKHNKAKENPLKTLLEIITNYFLEHRGTSRSISSSSALSAPQSKSSTSHQPNLSDEDHMCGSATTLDESRTQAHRRSPTSTCCKEDQMKDVLELVDVEAEETTGEVIKNPDLSTLYMLQVVSKAIDISLAKELKNLLFGSSLCCFSEEWKIQNFTFNNIPQLKYGIVQKKGGPCGVLAAVQACVLQRLIFADSNRNKDIRCLQPSEVHRTKCLTMAIADILWRAGGNEKAIVALPSGRQQFIPIGKYKADGILETLILHSATRYEDLVVFLQQNIHQFETGPCGCILLTVSVILSRSINLVRNDFDVLTNRLIGSHGYCTQELVNLLLTGKAVSNVFNNVIELDSGNGNITILKGITSRSDIGLLSLFEHYDVCQVGCYLKTPKYPIWLVCSESHFSVLFSLEKDLQGDWKTERKFDLYYYDGLANQEEEIRLTVDTTQMCAEDKENDLTPPLEHCIRTKWQGAVIDWNGTEPIL